MKDRGEVTFSATNGDWLILRPLSILLFLLPSLGRTTDWSLAAYGLPRSPLLELIFICGICGLAYGLIRWKTFVTVGDGWVDVKSPFVRKRLPLQGSRLEKTPISLLKEGCLLIQPDGKRNFLPLPAYTDKQPHKRLIFYWKLAEQGVDLRSDAIHQFTDQAGRAEGVSFDPVGAWKILVPGLTGFCLMFVPELVWFAAGQKPLLPLWLNWLIFAFGLAGALSILFHRRSQRGPVPKNGIVIEEGSVTLKKGGSDLWTAPFEDLRIEVTRSHGNLLKETLFKAFSKDLQLKIPDKFDHWPFDGEDVALSMLRLGVRVDISDEVWEMNT